MIAKLLSREHAAEQERERDLRNLFAQVASPYGSLHLFGARRVRLSELYEHELVGEKVPQMWHRGKLASSTGSNWPLSTQKR